MLKCQHKLEIDFIELQNVPEQSKEWMKCQNKETVLWAPTNACYKLLEQGPCERGEMLVLDDSSKNSTLETTCVKNCSE